MRAIVVRLAPTVHGPEDHGFILMLIATARRTRVSAYVGDGTNRWPAVHRHDAAVLFRLAVEKAPACSVLHRVAEPGIAFKGIAETIARGLVFPRLAAARKRPPLREPVHGGDLRGRRAGLSIRTQHLLGWTPAHEGPLQDLKHGDDFTVPVA